MKQPRQPRRSALGRRRLLAALSLLSVPFATGAAELDLSKLPPPAPREVDFDRDIQPIFENSCFKCHGPEKPKSKFRLDNRADALKGGSNGVAIVPGDGARSPLVQFAAGLDPDMVMPPAGKGDPLPPDKISLLRAWIDQGAKWGTNSPALASSTLFTVSPGLRWVSVQGNEQKFREHWGIKDGWGGTIQDFHFQERQGDLKVTADGRFASNPEDYKLRLNVDKDNVGFMRVGVDQSRTYYDDGGGFYAPYNAAPYTLGRDLHLDNEKVFVDVGLTLPNWPRMVLGYEHQYKQGEKSTLEWGSVNDVNIYPAFKKIDEQVHILKFDISHEIQGVTIEDNVRGEFYDLDNKRQNTDFSLYPGGPTPDSVFTYRERYNHFEGSNALRLEKQVRDWLFVSGGYLYTKLDGDTFFNAESIIQALAPPFTVGDTSNQIVIKQESHIFNLNTMLGPWDGLSLTAGLQNEWSKQQGFGDGLTLAQPSLFPTYFSSNLDKATWEENFGLRYTKIPKTVLFAETRFQQQKADHFENFYDLGFDDSHDFLRDTDEKSSLREFRAGLNFSPTPVVAFQPSFRHREKETDFLHLTDTDRSQVPALFPPFGAPGNGYSAFINNRETVTDTLEARLALRPANWLKVTLKYEISGTDFRTATDPVLLTVYAPGATAVGSPGGGMLSGNADSHTYSVNTVLTPWRRLYFSPTFSYTDTRLLTGINNQTQIVPYQGDIYSVLGGATFVVNDKTDLNATYSFSKANYRQDNEAAGLPLGIVYQQHGLMTGVTRRITKNFTAKLQYGYFRYREPSVGTANDYDAHAVFASTTLTL